MVGAVDRADVIDLLAAGRKQELNQKSINRRVLVAVMALREAGAVLELKKGDWPTVESEPDINDYSEEKMRRFFKARDKREWLIFQTYLHSGFRAREVATLDRKCVDTEKNVLIVEARPEYSFKPKSYERRTIRIPNALTKRLAAFLRETDGDLVFPTPPHPLRPDYGGNLPDAHHLELCKETRIHRNPCSGLLFRSAYAEFMRATRFATERI